MRSENIVISAIDSDFKLRRRGLLSTAQSAPQTVSNKSAAKAAKSAAKAARVGTVCQIPVNVGALVGSGG
jgi:hypothetical protein